MEENADEGGGEALGSKGPVHFGGKALNLTNIARCLKQPSPWIKERTWKGGKREKSQERKGGEH